MVDRLKAKLLEINASVMADGPEWVAPGDIAAAKVKIDTTAPADPPKPGSPMEELLLRIDRTELPAAYQPQQHQQYVDARMGKLSAEQQARIGKLWQEKRRIDPQMRARGQSFVRIMEFVAEHEK